MLVFELENVIEVLLLIVLSALCGILFIVIGWNLNDNKTKEYEIISSTVYISKDNDKIYKIEFIGSNKEYQIVYLNNEQYSEWVKDDTIITIDNTIYKKISQDKSY